MTRAHFQSRQWMTVLWILLPMSTLAVALFGIGADKGQSAHTFWNVLGIMLVVNLIVLSMFAHLSIVLNARGLYWRFGVLPWPRWELAGAEIAFAEVCQSKWYEGKGIRLTAEGMLYNAAGNGAVRVHKKDGKSFRLGCNNPQQLSTQINILCGAPTASAK
ncbi:hypothetical protein [Undibacterium fentianense]|uniref:Uncharacterized protein n=1 Tax=Undibacterium fentianense TaxID=2828728 RepID=A0A941E1Q9_9BURK|nr:hypothetical protein [Undibacterium fentianense]MBR7800765.1 hypothetical protein [Undibacterium fentianense]